MKTRPQRSTLSSLLTAQRSADASEQLDPRPDQIERQRKLDLLSKVRVLRDKLKYRGAVEGDPNKVYVWVSKDEATRTAFDGMGYTICKDATVKTSWLKGDNTHQRGDLILYEIPRDLHEAIKLSSELQSLEGDDAESLFLNFAQENRIPAEKLNVG